MRILEEYKNKLEESKKTGEVLRKILEEYNNKLEEHKRTGKALRKEGLKIFEAAAKEVFESNPKLESFGWTQYTPNFNDGDICYFSVNEDNIYINEISIYDLEYENGEYVYEGVEKFDGIENPENLVNEIRDLILSIDQDSLEEYGEGLVTIKREGTVDVEYYDHD